MKALFVDNVLLEQTATGFAIELQPHLGLISLIATLRAAAHVADLYDPKIGLANGNLNLGPGLYEAAAREILDRSPDVVGFTSLGSNFLCTLKVARAVRRARPQLPILLGGPHASIVDREIIAGYDAFDVIVRGEAEATITDVFAALGGSLPFASIAGLTYRDAGRIARTRDVSPILDMDALPMAAYDAYPIADLQIRTLDIDAGRGCPFGCSFCSTASFFGRRYRIKSAQRLVAELDMLAATYGVRNFNLTHDLFTVNKDSVRAFCAAVAGRGYTWNCSARMDCVDEGLLREMRDAGCDAIYYGVETGSARLQKVVDKRLNLALYHPTLRSSVDLGLRTTVSFITGFPDETAADQHATLDLIGETLTTYPSDVGVQLHLLAPEPGTALFAQHAAALAYDGHISDFNFPLLEVDDAAQIVADPTVFACHHHYANGGGRANDIGITNAFRTLYRLGHVFLGAICRRFGTSFADLLGEFVRVRSVCISEDDTLCALIAAKFGASDPFIDIVRYIVASRGITEDPSSPLTEDVGTQRIRLSHRVRPIDDCRNGAQLLQRLAAGEDVGTILADRQPHLIIAAAGKTAFPTMVAVDATTCAIATALCSPTTCLELTARFNADELRHRLWSLTLMGVIMPAASDQLNSGQNSLAAAQARDDGRCVIAS